MGANVVVVLPPCLDDANGLGARTELLHAQAFVAESAIEALVGADALGHCPPEDRLRNELGAVIRAEMPGRAMDADQASEDIDNPSRPMLPATSIARHSRVHSSTTVRHLSWRPSAHASKTKSTAQTWFRLVGAVGRGRPVAMRFRGRFR